MYYDKEDMVVWENTIKGVDPLIVFGPLSARLSHFFEQGYSLRAISYKPGDRKWSEKIHLIKDREKWLVGRVPRHWFTTPQGLSLADYVKDGVQVIFKGSYEFRDSLDLLVQRYPRKVVKKAKPAPMVGNRLLRELLVESVEELRQMARKP